MILALLFNSSLYAFTLFGPYSNLTGYNVDDLYIYLNPNSCPQDFSQTVSHALEVWNEVPMSRLKLHYAGNTTTAASDLRTSNFSEQLVIACSTQFEIDSQDQNGSNGCSGSCLNQVYARSGIFTNSSHQLTKAYIVINMNSSAQAKLDSLSFSQQEIVIAHELGHTLGIGHSEYSEALMYSYIDGKTELSLDRDDKQAMVFLYPYERTLGCGSLKNSAPWFLVLMLFPIWILYLFKISNVNYCQKSLQKNS